MDETSSFKLVKLSDLSIVPGTCIVSKVPDDKLLPTDPDTFLNGRVSVTIPDSITSTLVYERGDKVDGYYYKPVYEGVVTIGFSDAQADIIAVVPDIYVVPTGIVV